MAEIVGPKVVVDVQYVCNGCTYLRIDEDPVVDGEKRQSCHHPEVIDKYSCPQHFGIGGRDLTVRHPARTPKFLCPCIRIEDRD